MKKLVKLLLLSMALMLVTLLHFNSNNSGAYLLTVTTYLLVIIGTYMEDLK